jgi:hypothetical protein
MPRLGPIGWAVVASLALAGAAVYGLDRLIARERASQLAAARAYVRTMYPESGAAVVVCSPEAGRCDARLRGGLWLALQCAGESCVELSRHVEP